MTIERFAELTMIWWPSVSGWRDSIRRQLRSWAEDAGPELDASIKVEQIESALKLVEQGLGNRYVLRTVYESASFPAGSRSLRSPGGFTTITPSSAGRITRCRQRRLS
jgi:hypothetical protein